MFWIENITLISGGILMKVLDVRPFQDGIQRNTDMLTRVEQEMQQIQKTISGLVAMEDHLKGQGGNAIRAFYNDCHIPFLQFFTIFQTGFKERLSQMKLALDGLEPDPNGYIKQAFLEGEVEEGLTAISKITESLTDESNSIMDQVSDIVALPHLNDSEVQQGVNDSRKKRDLTVSDLCEFDMTQTNSLTNVEQDLVTLEKWLIEIEALMTNGLSDIYFPADVWKEFAETQPLPTELDGKDPQTDFIEDKSKSTDPEQDLLLTNSQLETTKNISSNVSRANTTVTGFSSSFSMYLASQKGSLITSREFDSKTGKYYTKIKVNSSGLDHLGVTPDAKALKDLNRALPKNGKAWKPKHYDKAATNTTVLKYATKQKGQSGWSGVGEMALKNHSSLEYLGTPNTVKDISKTVGKAALKGAGKSFKDIVDVKGMAQSGLKGVGNKIAPVAAAVSFYSNYHEGKSTDNLSTGEAITRATKQTAVELAVSGAVQTAAVAAGTALIPIPGVGTAVGVAVGIGINALLNKEFGKGKNKKSAMSTIKGWFK